MGREEGTTLNNPMSSLMKSFIGMINRNNAQVNILDKFKELLDFGGPLKDLLAGAGNMMSFIDGYTIEKGKQAMANGESATMPVTFGENIQGIKDTLGNWGAGMAMEGGLKIINDLLAELNEWFSSENGQEFLEKLSMGVFAAAYGIEMIVEGFKWLGAAIQELGPLADMLFFGLFLVGIAMAISLLWSMLAPIVGIAVSMLAIYWPVLLIGVAIMGLISLLSNFGITTSDIVAFIGGLLGGLFAFISNIFITLNNIIISFAEFFMNLWIDPVYAVKKLFYDLTNSIAEFFWSMINGLIDGVNWIIEKVNGVAGTSFDTVANIEPKYMELPESEKEIVNLDAYRLKLNDMSEMAGKGSNIATDLYNKVQNSASNGLGSGFMGENSLDSVGEVKKLGQVEGEVDITQEDIKYLLDATTQKNVNSINLTVQTQAPVINNNGTIREESDLKKVTEQLAAKMLEKNVVANQN